MKALKFLLLVPVCLSLTGCACGRSSDYQGTPYETERTAGTGMVDTGCFRRTID